MWIYLDNDNRVQGYNPNNMEGNTGWFWAETPPPEDYMDYLYIDGQYIYDPLPVPDPPDPIPTTDERLTALESAMQAIEEGIASV